MIDFQDEFLTEEQLQELVAKGYIECKREWFGRKKYLITQKGKEYFNIQMSDKINYIQ